MLCSVLESAWASPERGGGGGGGGGQDRMRGRHLTARFNQGGGGAVRFLFRLIIMPC